MKAVLMFAPHFIGDCGFESGLMDDEEEALLHKTEADGRGVFCLPLVHLTQSLPVGFVVKLSHGDSTVEFTVYNIFYVPDRHPDVVFYKSQMTHMDDGTADSLLDLLLSRHQEYHYGG